MSLSTEIDQKLKESMKARDMVTVGTLRLVKSAINYALSTPDAEASDEEVITVLRKEIKKRQESIEGFAKVGRDEDVAKEQQEIELIETFLPAPMSQDDLDVLVKEAIEESGATSKKEMGKAMKVASQKAAGRVDGKTLSQAIQKALL